MLISVSPMSTTPFFNCVEDFKGLAPLILLAGNDKLWESTPVAPNFDPFQASDDDLAAKLCFAHRALENFLWSDEELVGSPVDTIALEYGAAN